MRLCCLKSSLVHVLSLFLHFLGSVPVYKYKGQTSTSDSASLPAVCPSLTQILSMGSPNIYFLAAIVSLLHIVSAKITPSVTSSTFRDITVASGLNQIGPDSKFGGPCVADINNDGHYDLLLGYHASNPMQVFFGSKSGKFTEHPTFTVDEDIHGISVAQRTAASRNRIFTVNIGGRRGREPRAPLIFEVTPDKKIRDVTNKLGFGKGKGRGRETIFMDLGMRTPQQMRDNGGGPDPLFVNFLGNPENGLREFAYENVKGRYKFRSVPGYDLTRETRAQVIDIDGDGRMELVSFRVFQIFKLIAPFTFRESTLKYVPAGINQLAGVTVSSVVEFDYDNDGDFDMYVSRTANTLISNDPPKDSRVGVSDVLFQNRNGKLVDVTAKAGIPKNTLTQGATAGDFNNDGFIDLMLSVWNSSDIFLMNQGDGTFKTVKGILPRKRSDRGDHAVAVDLDLDGHVDLVVGRGAHRPENGAGLFHIFQNTMQVKKSSHYLLVLVRNDPTRASTSLHAVVTLFLREGRTMMRRVGSRGTQAGGQSYIDTVHFGLGRLQNVNGVRVRWTSGVERAMVNVSANQKVTFGII